MSELKNLWQVINRDDLLYHLRNSEKKFIVLTLVLLDTDESLKGTLRKYIKRKSIEYPNISFVYYSLRKEDFGKIGSLVPNDLSHYPVMYHIYNKTKMLVEVPSIDKSKAKFDELDKSFSLVHECYSTFDPNATEDQNQQKQNNKNKYDEEEYEEYEEYDEYEDEDEIINNDNNKQQYNLIPQNSNNTMIKTNNVNYANTNQPTQVDKTTEKKKLVEKILFIQKKGELYMDEIFDEIKKRKKEEEKLKNKEKKSDR